MQHYETRLRYILRKARQAPAKARGRRGSDGRATGHDQPPCCAGHGEQPEGGNQVAPDRSGLEGALRGIGQHERPGAQHAGHRQRSGTIQFRGDSCSFSAESAGKN